VILSGLVFAVSLLAPPRGPCSASPDIVRVLKRQIALTFTAVDTADLRAQGLPLHVTTVALVHDSTVCTHALEALNANDTSSSATRTRAAYVFVLDSVAYVATPANDLNLFTYYDRAWRPLTNLVALD